MATGNTIGKLAEWQGGTTRHNGMLFSVVPLKRDCDCQSQPPRHLPSLSALQDRCGTVPGYSHAPLAGLSYVRTAPRKWLPEAAW